MVFAGMERVKNCVQRTIVVNIWLSQQWVNAVMSCTFLIYTCQLHKKTTTNQSSLSDQCFKLMHSTRKFIGSELQTRSLHSQKIRLKTSLATELKWQELRWTHWLVQNKTAHTTVSMVQIFMRCSNSSCPLNKMSPRKSIFCTSIHFNQIIQFAGNLEHNQMYLNYPCTICPKIGLVVFVGAKAKLLTLSNTTKSPQIWGVSCDLVWLHSWMWYHFRMGRSRCKPKHFFTWAFVESWQHICGKPSNNHDCVSANPDWPEQQKTSPASGGYISAKISWLASTFVFKNTPLLGIITWEGLSPEHSPKTPSWCQEIQRFNCLEEYIIQYIVLFHVLFWKLRDWTNFKMIYKHHKHVV